MSFAFGFEICKLLLPLCGWGRCLLLMVLLLVVWASFPSHFFSGVLRLPHRSLLLSVLVLPVSARMIDCVPAGPVPIRLERETQGLVLGSRCDESLGAYNNGNVID